VAARRVQDNAEVGRGGTHQARYERDVIRDSVASRLDQLDLGGSSLVFGRIDVTADANSLANGGGADGDSYYIGRVAVWDDEQDPVVVDWRAPVAEPFYRATGWEPLGLVRRRHFSTRGRTLLGLEDEYFGEGSTERGAAALESQLRGEQTLRTSLESARTGRLGDIVATIQSEQDEIIRAPLQGALVVQGGPGTGKTVVALHRAAYLLYTHRFPLEGQGVLVVGPNRVFLTYIEQVLPSLGEAGIELGVLADLIPETKVMGRDVEPVARVKGDERMAEVLRRAMLDRERPLREDLVLGYGLQRLRLSVADSSAVVRDARRRSRNHNIGRKIVEDLVYEKLAVSARTPIDPAEVRESVHGTVEMREVLEWMWPVLTPVQFLHDLLGSKSLLRSAARGVVDRDEIEAIHRKRSAHSDDVTWTVDDVPLLDEARWLLGARPGKGKQEAVRTYGHIVVDEAQDLSPMQLRMLNRRSLSGSFTIVGDIGQATGAWAHDDWESILDHLPDKHPPRHAELTVGYRLPGPTMAVAAKVLAVAAPDLTPPRAVRAEGVEPRFVATAADSRTAAIIDAVGAEIASVGTGNLAVITPASISLEVSDALDAAGISHGEAYRGALNQQITVVPIGLVKGLELDAAIVVEPSRIVAEQQQGLRALYVALTRATQRLTVVHAEPLPRFLTD
jgi:DNA helicase IV